MYKSILTKSFYGQNKTNPYLSKKKTKTTHIPKRELFKQGFFAGIGWAFGVTIGFVIVSTLLVAVFQRLGGIPIIGSFLASLVEETQKQLLKRTPNLYP